jgi:pimeloyl-ACP methyl ester carboxylesterase
MPQAKNGAVELYFETFGEPTDPALLMVNGLGSQSINYADEWCERFVARGFFVIRFDNRDVGLSTKFDDAGNPMKAVQKALVEKTQPDVPYRLSDLADDAVAVLDHLGIERAHIMGVSMGGMIVQQVAIAHPERVITMTSVMSSTGDRDVGQASPEAFAVLMGAPAKDRDTYIANHVKGNGIYGSPAHFDAERLAASAAAAYDRCFNPGGVARQMAAVIVSGSRSEALRNVTVPTLVMHGDADTLVDISGGRRTAECIPGAKFVVMEGMGHDYPPAFWDRWVELVGDHAGVPETS